MVPWLCHGYPVIAVVCSVNLGKEGKLEEEKRKQHVLSSCCGLEFYEL